MKITKFAICFLFLTVLFLTLGCNDGYDDSELTGRVENLENRVQKLEEQMNSNISSLQSIMEALENNDYITGVTPIIEGGKEIGYTISFKKGNPITIYHGQNGQNGQDGKPGEDGQDGYTPQIGVKQDTDGIYYWTLDGEWMTDESGNKIKAQGIDGKDGQDGQDGAPGEDGQDGKPGEDGQDGKPGEDGQDGQDGMPGEDGQDGQDGNDGITPQLKIEDKYWWVSYDNGKTWEKLGQATEEDVKNIFQSVTVKESEVEFILSDGTTFIIPLKVNIEISYSIEDGEIGISEGHSVYVDYRLSNANEKAVVTASSDGNFITKVIREDIYGGKISITSSNGATEGYINVMVSDGNGYTFINVINIYENRIVFSEGMQYNISYTGGDIAIPFSINTSYVTKIVDGASWVSINSQSRANMRNETINISVKPNTSNSDRIAKIQLYNPSNEEDVFAEITITQQGIDEEAFIFVTEANENNGYTAYLPKIIGSNITIDWGDGTKENYETTGFFTHTYSVNQSTPFEIKITGDIKGLNSYDLKIHTITEVKQWGKSKLESMKHAFFGNKVLKTISGDTFGAFENVTDFSSTFSDCSGLSSIPESLFDNCPNVTDFNSIFHHCTSLSSIPAGLFDNCPNVTDFSSTFSYCYRLSSIPAGLFDNCPNVTDFSGTFDFCSSLSSIPAGLFDNCPNVTDFNSTFAACYQLFSIPAGLFDNCPNVTEFFLTFSYCTSLSSIPAGLFDNCPNVTKFLATFSRCTSLTSIPVGLFDNCPNVTDFTHTFLECSSLTSIPVSLFDNNLKVEGFEGTFEDCTRLQGESPYTVIDGPKYHLYERKQRPDYFATPKESSYDNEISNGCFNGCTGLSDYNDIPSSWK